MVETIGRQLEDVVLGQRLFSDIQVWSNFKTTSASCFQNIINICFPSLLWTTEWSTLTNPYLWLAVI